MAAVAQWPKLSHQAGHCIVHPDSLDEPLLRSRLPSHPSLEADGGRVNATNGESARQGKKGCLEKHRLGNRRVHPCRIVFVQPERHRGGDPLPQVRSRRYKPCKRPGLACWDSISAPIASRMAALEEYPLMHRPKNRRIRLIEAGELAGVPEVSLSLFQKVAHHSPNAL